MCNFLLLTSEDWDECLPADQSFARSKREDGGQLRREDGGQLRREDGEQLRARYRH